jgi:L-asparaginase
VIRIIVTGGTFDKTYDEINGRLSFGTTHLPEMLRLGRSRVETTIETLMMIDSLNMTEADRARIAQSCARCPETRMVITHGTDTMVETARVIASWGPPSLGAVAASAAKAAGGPGTVHNKTIVLTGAMVPYAFGSSDGLFNLGSALSFAEVLPPGVYIAMNGQHFSWDRVRKNRETGVFERT